MKDPVMIDEAKFDRLSEAQEILREQKMDEARTEYEMGELDDWIIDDASKRDCVLVALEVLRYLDNPATVSGDIVTISYALRHVSCEIKDFRATVEHIIEQRADILAQE